MLTKQGVGVPEASKFNTTIDSKDVKLYTLKNNLGMEAHFINYGGRLISLVVPDKNGKPTDVVIGLESSKAFKKSEEHYFGTFWKQDCKWRIFA